MKSRYLKIASFASAAILCCSTSAVYAGTHDISEINGLQTALDSKADQAHGHFYGNMTTVAISGGEYTSPVDAMNDISNWCGVPSVANPCLVKVMPGVYDLGTENIMLTSNVSIEGSGASATKITSSSDTSTMGNGTTTVVNVSLAGMTIENTTSRAIYTGISSSLTISDAAITAIFGGVQVGKYATLEMNDSTIQVSGPTTVAAISATDHKSIKLSDVTIDAFSSTEISYQGARGVYTYSYWYGYDNQIDLDNVTVNVSSTGGTSYGVMLTGYKMINGTARLNNVKTTATGGYQTQAVMIQGPYNVTMNGVTAVAVDGASNWGLVGNSYGYGEHVVKVMNSSFTGSNASVNNGASSSAEVMSIANTNLDGPVMNGVNGILKCIGNFDGNFDPVTCM